MPPRGRRSGICRREVLNAIHEMTLAPAEGHSLPLLSELWRTIYRPFARLARVAHSPRRTASRPCPAARRSGSPLNSSTAGLRAPHMPDGGGHDAGAATNRSFPGRRCGSRFWPAHHGAGSPRAAFAPFVGGLCLPQVSSQAEQHCRPSRKPFRTSSHRFGPSRSTPSACVRRAEQNHRIMRGLQQPWVAKNFLRTWRSISGW